MFLNRLSITYFVFLQLGGILGLFGCYIPSKYMLHATYHMQF